MERRYLLVPGLRSSRIHILDTKPDPRQPALVKVISADEVASRTGYSRPHTIHCGPEAIYVSALGAPEGEGPGGIFTVDPDDFGVRGAWEVERGPQYFAYDFWWHLGHDTLITSEWGTPSMVEAGVNPESVAGRQVRARPARLDAERRPPSADDRPGSGATDGAGAAALARPQPDLWLRQCGPVTQRPLVVDLGLAPRERHLASAEGDRDPCRACRCGRVAARAQALRRGTAAGDRHRPQPGRSVPVRLLLGHRRVPTVRRQRPVPSAAHRLGPARRHRRIMRRTQRAVRSTAARRWWR